ncbi:type 1 glutamine amidotransferase family protein [Tessaracoccus coleopterorum]|uniref:hypothetical protein n=1 Tax=Tessaracoccus coleopterorum TaxID=2714950 RepID=UPI0022B21F8F|nr:hypothetical protein [Tessaracoccus coleopterorum]
MSQLRGKWPVTGRKIAVIVDADTPPDVAFAAKEAVQVLGMAAFITAPSGGKLGDLVVDRAYLTAASIEFDAALALVAPVAAPTRCPPWTPRRAIPRPVSRWIRGW